ncbi:MAG: 1-acyl-sn-glycerol-3-phosphate acyltransferase [Methylotenera sp.]|nr:1-acyl-sn-glycerol-3-phosphate acyltransferase [Methylotenera sp.]
MTRYFRISRIVTHTLVGVIIASLVFPIASKSLKNKLIKWWCRRLLAIFNLRITSHGHIPHPTMSGAMVVANHISWVDIHALNSIVPLRFIAKSEISKWPVFGYLAKKSNVLFIDRDKRQLATRIVTMTSKSLLEGDNLCIFPEGTTTDGTNILPFKSSIIQAAIQANASIHPVAIRYPSLDGSNNISMAYAGETTMIESIQQILLQKNPAVELHFLTPIITAGRSENAKGRRELTLSIQASIRQKLDF